MSKILAFKRAWDGYEDLEELLREFFAAELELENDEVLQAIVRRGEGP